MSVPVGITVPKLLPITGTFAPLFATYFMILSGRVVMHRVRMRKALGLPAEPANTAVPPDELTIAARCHANFAEHVPMALFLGAVCELNGGNRKVLTTGLSVLFVARILHVEMGLRGERTLGRGRTIGHAYTLSSIVLFGAYAAYLVKGYWGF